MALITRLTGTVSPTNFDGAVDGLFAGEVLGVGSGCFIHTDGLVYQTVGGYAVTGTYAQTKFDGIVMANKAVGEPVTLFGEGSRIGSYASALTPGAMLYVSATAGALADVPLQVNEVPVAKALSTTDIKILR